MLIHQIMASLKKERQRQGLTLADLSVRSGIDQAALSKLETGSHSNPTLETLYRVALGLNKEIVCVLRDPLANGSRRRRLVRA